MKSLNFKGSGDIPSSCEYAITELGDKTAIVFSQPLPPGTLDGPALTRPTNTCQSGEQL